MPAGTPKRNFPTRNSAKKPLHTPGNPSRGGAANYTPPTSTPPGAPSVGVQGFGGTVDSPINLNSLTGEILNVTPGTPIGATVVDPIGINLLGSIGGQTVSDGSVSNFFSAEGYQGSIQSEDEETNPIKKFLQKFMPVLHTDSDVKFDYGKIFVVVGGLSVFIYLLFKFSKRK